MARNFDNRSRWLLRAMEWDEPRARYPNLFRDGMPERLVLSEHNAARLRLGDLIAVYYPASEKHPARSGSYIGLSRVIALSKEPAGSARVELETAHRFDPPLHEEQPRRVFLCADPGWSDVEVQLFRRVFGAAISAGYTPRDEERESSDPERPAPSSGGRAASEAGAEGARARRSPAAPAKAAARPAPEAPVPSAVPRVEPTPGARTFAGVDYSGDMRDPRGGTWLALLELTPDESLRVCRLEATGRAGLQGILRDPDSTLMNAEAIGMDFPFGVPVPFAEKLLEAPFPDEGWWALAKRMERMSRPGYLMALEEFRDANGEVKRLTDERANAFSPLHRVNPDLGPMTFHGIRMIAEDRSRYAVRPFENAQGRLLLEVYPGATVRGFAAKLRGQKGRQRLRGIVDALTGLGRLPVRIDQPVLQHCLASRDAVDAVLAARCAALAVLSGETERTPEELSPDDAQRVRREGWIYGLDS